MCSAVDFIYWLYIFPAVICIVSGFVEQATTGTNRTGIFYYLVPVVNIFIAVVVCMFVIGYVGIVIAELPSLVRAFFKTKR